MNETLIMNNHIYSNFFETEKTYEEDIKKSKYIFKTPEGICWLSLRENIYYLFYSINDFQILENFVSDYKEILIKNNALLEIIINESNFQKKHPSLFEILKKSNFIIDSYHSAFVKNYFKDLKNNSSAIITISQKHLSLINDYFNTELSSSNDLTFDYFCQFLNNKNYLIYGHLENEIIAGFIILNIEENIEKIGFISFISIKNTENLPNNTVEYELIRSALNIFAQKDFKQAFIWNDINSESIEKNIIKYGFTPLNKENILFLNLENHGEN